MKKFLPISIIFLLFSCNNDDDSIQKSNTELPQLIHAKYLLENNNPSFIDGLLEFSYDNNLPIEMKGDLFFIFPNDNTHYGFNPNTTRKFTKNNNEILVNQTNTGDNHVNSNQTTYRLNDNKLIVSIDFNSQNPNGIKYYTNYYYEKNQLVKTLRYWKGYNDEWIENSGTEKLYYYNNKGNLDSIVSKTVVINNDLSTQYDTVQFKYKSIEIFEDYDNSPNPFKQLFLVKELLKKSLSNNNYRKVIEKGFYEKKLVQFKQIEFGYLYKNGKVDLTK